MEVGVTGELALAARPVDEPQPPAVLFRIAGLAGRDEREPPLPAGLLDDSAHTGTSLVADAAERSRLDDDRAPVRSLSSAHTGRLPDAVVGHAPRRVLPQRLDRT